MSESIPLVKMSDVNCYGLFVPLDVLSFLIYIIFYDLGRTLPVGWRYSVFAFPFLPVEVGITIHLRLLDWTQYP